MNTQVVNGKLVQGATQPESPPKTPLTEQEKKDLKKLKDLSQQFEGVFINQLMQAMRRTVPKTEYLGGGMGEDTFTSLLDQEYSNEMAKTGESDIGKNLYRQLSDLYLENSPSKNSQVDPNPGRSVKKENGPVPPGERK